MNLNITPILQAVIDLLAAIVLCCVIPWIRAKTTSAQQQNADKVIKVLVQAAEQMFGGGHGAEKLEFVRNRLAEYGYNVDAEEIESAVWEYINNLPTLYVEPEKVETVNE